MTDPASSPGPHPVSDPAGPPVPRPAHVAAVPAALRGRMLLQVGPTRVSYVREQLDPACSGLVISGARAANKVRLLREEGYTGPLLADPARYTEAAASGEVPFPEAEEGQLSFSGPLETAVAEQLAYGASAALSPTGYVRAEDSDALQAAVRGVRELADARVVLAMPVDVGWLRAEAVGQLIAELNEAPGAVALMLGGQMDPLACFPEAVSSLRRLLTEVPGTALLRSDLAAFGALAHGAAFTAFGATSGVRHIVPPPQPAKRSPGGPTSPHVLFPQLMDFFLGGTLAKRFAAAQAPVCRCAACGERELDSFVSNRFQVPAAAHNTAVLMEWLGSLRALDEGAARRRWWHEQCRRAVNHYPLLNAELDQPGAFNVPAQLACWAAGPGPDGA